MDNETYYNCQNFPLRRENNNRKRNKITSTELDMGFLGCCRNFIQSFIRPYNNIPAKKKLYRLPNALNCETGKKISHSIVSLMNINSFPVIFCYSNENFCLNRIYQRLLCTIWPRTIFDGTYLIEKRSTGRTLPFYWFFIQHFL